MRKPIDDNEYGICVVEVVCVPICIDDSAKVCRCKVVTEATRNDGPAEIASEIGIEVAIVTAVCEVLWEVVSRAITVDLHPNCL